MVAVPSADDVSPPGDAEGDAADAEDFLRQALPAASEATRDAVAAVLDDAERDAEATWPGVRFPPRHAIWRRVLSGLDAGVAPVEALRQRHLADRMIAAACAAGEPRAMRWVDERHLAHIGRFVRKLDDTPAFADEVRQVVREKIFLGGEALQPKIAEYGGVGPLEGWLRVVAVRTAQNVLRARKPHAEPPSLELPLAVAAHDPELALARTQSATTFRSCFAEAVAALSAEERTLLLLHYLDGLNSDTIARMYGLGGATVRRRIAATRARLLAETRRRVGAHLHLPSADVDHVWAELRSDFDLSLSRILAWLAAVVVSRSRRACGAPRIALFASVAFTLALGSASARAQSAPPPEPSAPGSTDASQAEARAQHQRGMRAYDLGNFDEAIAAFRRAYQLSPAPGLLFNLAQAQRGQGEAGCADALRSYRAYLRAQPDASNRDFVNEQIAAMDRCVADQERRRAASAPSGPPATTPSPAAVPVVAERSWAPPWPTIVLGAAGVVALGVGTGLYLSSSSEFDSLQGACGSDCDPASWEGYRTREQVGVALLVTGGALVVGSAVYWLVSGGTASAAPRTGHAGSWPLRPAIAF